MRFYKKCSVLEVFVLREYHNIFHLTFYMDVILVIMLDLFRTLQNSETYICMHDECNFNHKNAVKMQIYFVISDNKFKLLKVIEIQRCISSLCIAFFFFSFFINGEYALILCMLHYKFKYENYDLLRSIPLENYFHNKIHNRYFLLKKKNIEIRTEILIKRKMHH